MGISDVCESVFSSNTCDGGGVPAGCAQADPDPIQHRITHAHQVTPDPLGIGLVNGH